MSRRLLVAWVCILQLSVAAADLSGFHASNQFNEQVKLISSDNVRTVIDAAANFDAQHPTTLIVYALPNGNSIEQTIGCSEQPGTDWHFYIQHIGAQTRALREMQPERNVVIAYVEASTPGIGKSWPTWRQNRPDNAGRIRGIVDAIVQQIPGSREVVLCAHSGGGSFITGYLNSAAAVDDRITRIAYLDANYSYDDEQQHGDKLLAWLTPDVSRHLVVIAYDDRNIVLNGKPVVSATGGTWRASGRMIERFKQDQMLEQSTCGDNFDTFSGMGTQIRFFLHRNPKNLILHTRLVGEMNGFLTAMTVGTKNETLPGAMDAKPIFAQWIAPVPVDFISQTREPSTAPASREAGDLKIPPPPANRITGTAFIDRVAILSRDDREAAIVEQIKLGNVPSWMRCLDPVRVKFVSADGAAHLAEYRVTPDYLAIGPDNDFIRMPMLPATAQRIADLLDCNLPTRKMVDDIDAAAGLKLEPQPMVEQRESPKTFLAHQALIEQQRAGRGTGDIICGIKKDIVITNLLAEKPHRVAIYGWRKSDGKPIQPLTTVHADTYVDYSHGVRLIARQMLVDGRETSVETVLHDPALCGALSDEGVIDHTPYR